MADDTPKRTDRAPDFRIIPADTFGLRLNDNLVQLSVSMDVNVQGTSERMVFEQAIIALSPRSAKVLALVMQKAITVFEERFGAISLPPGKEEQIKSPEKS